LLHQQADRFGLVLPENAPQNQWHTLDGNTNEIRKQRQQDVLNQALGLRIETGHTYLEAPGKEYSLFNKLNPMYRWKRFLYHCYKGHESSETVNNGLHSKIIERILSRLTLVCKAEEKDLPVVEGIREGLKSFIGPEVVHLDLTSRCNMNCIACWNESPLVTGGSTQDDTSADVLSYETIKNLIDDLIQLRGMRRLKLSGGEPTMHPKFKEILAYLKRKDKYLEIEVNTNFSLVDEKLIKQITDLEVDLLTVSLWAGTAAVYKRTHPNQSEKTFHRIVENLNILVNKRKTLLPRISIHNVLMNLNYNDVDAMMELSLDIGADENHFVLIDPVPGKTDQLLLNHEQRKALVERLIRIEDKLDRFRIYTEPSSGRSIRVANIDELIGKLSQPGIEEGIYDKKTIEKIPCYIGWMYTRVMADGKIAPCCKGHRLPMGNLYKQRFKEIWKAPKYTRFRHNGLTLEKSAPYFSAIGNKVTSQTGCYNCDNIMHNLVMHEKYLFYSNYKKWVKFQLHKWINRKI
jgi:MoaA/NifB/PqqE/SkfB family radical SAM enzyme